MARSHGTGAGYQPALTLGVPVSTMIAKGYLVHGRVQGVGFRWWASGHARRLGLAGSARNRPDGAVELFLYGPTAAVSELARRLHDGPPVARVERVVEISPPPSVGEPPVEFRILR